MASVCPKTPSHRSDKDRITVVDTREQEPYAFDPRCEVVRQALPAGDYSIKGLKDFVAVERKTLDDFVSTVIQARSPQRI